MAVLNHQHGSAGRFLGSFGHVVREHREARRLVVSLRRRRQEAIHASRVADSRLEQLQGRDVHAIAISTWQAAAILVLLMASEGWFHYLAAEGLFLDHTMTVGVAFALTVVAGLIAFALAHEERAHRREVLRGEVTRRRHRLAAVAAIGLAFLIAGFFLRRAYFVAVARLDEGVFGSLPLAPWLTALILTVLAGIFILLAAYVLAHADHELAAARQAHRVREREFGQIDQGLRSADERFDRADTALHTHVTISAGAGSHALLHQVDAGLPERSHAVELSQADGAVGDGPHHHSDDDHADDDEHHHEHHHGTSHAASHG